MRGGVRCAVCRVPGAGRDGYMGHSLCVLHGHESRESRIGYNDRLNSFDIGQIHSQANQKFSPRII